MKQKVYSVFDKVALEFGPPFCAKNDEVAKRQFNHLVRSQELALGEFELWILGGFDTEKGLTNIQHNLVFMFPQDGEVKNGEAV